MTIPLGLSWNITRLIRLEGNLLIAEDTAMHILTVSSSSELKIVVGKIVLEWENFACEREGAFTPT